MAKNASDSRGPTGPDSGRRKRRHVWLLLPALLVVAGGVYYWMRSGEVVEADQPLIVAVGIGDIENTIAAAGSLQPRRIVDVGAQVSGQLQKLHVEVGDTVEEGQLLAEIDARSQENRLESSRANIEALRAQIASRQASLELARANAERQAKLMAADATSEQEYDTAMNNLASAESNLIQLEKQIEQNLASLAIDEVQLEYTKIYAPIAGTVVAIKMNEGVTLNATQQAPTILQIADLTTMTVETQISEADVGKLRPGMDVYFTTLGSGDRRWYSTLRQILPTPETENNVVLYTGLFDIANDDGALLSGMTTQVYFVTSAARGVLTVPVGALTYRDVPTREEMAERMAARGAGQGEAGEEAGARSGSGSGGAAGQGAFPGGNAPGGGGGAGGRQFPRGQFPQGGFPGGADGGGRFGAGLAARGAAGDEAARPRPATVRLVRDDGTIVDREIVVGVTSRVAAEVLEGLSPGDRVVAGIVQTAAPEQQTNNNNNRGFRGGPVFIGR